MRGEKMQEALRKILKYIPERIANSIQIAAANTQVEEIRLRENKNVVLVTDGVGKLLNTVCTKEELSECVSRLCRNSIHAHLDTIKKGFISVAGGYRVGVCGREIFDHGAITNVTDITSLNIRIPNEIYDVSNPLLEYLAEGHFRKSVLIYSAPGVGKTTLLRDITIKLTTPPYLKRVSLIDTRSEITSYGFSKAQTLDIYLDYPKAKGIEMATRTMNPEIIVCDEIGTMEEASAILAVQNTGVPLIATAHAVSVTELLSRTTIKLLHDAKVFSTYVGIRRGRGKGYIFSFTRYEDVNL